MKLIKDSSAIMLVIWAMLLLGESYSGSFWAAVALMMAGMFLVQPRRRESVALGAIDGQDA